MTPRRLEVQEEGEDTWSVSSAMRRAAASGESALQMSRESGWRMSLQLMAMLIAVSCLSPVITHTCSTHMPKLTSASFAVHSICVAKSLHVALVDSSTRQWNRTAVSNAHSRLRGKQQKESQLAHC